MNERSQGAAEYFLTLAAVLLILASLIFVTVVAMGDLGSSVENSIKETRDNAIGGLT